MMAAEIATAQVDTDTRMIRCTLIGAPDLKQKRDGRPFIVERARVEIDGRFAYATVEGRAIRVDGQLGKAYRWRTYTLRHEGRAPRYWDPAPSWLIEALKAAGVTW